MIDPLPPALARVLARGAFCHLAARTRHGPHLTPVVFALHGPTLWITTSRRSVKARAWRRVPIVAGLVRAGALAVSFVGRVRPYDLLDPATWLPSALAAPTLTLAAARFTAKNARFFAGYAADARHVPLAWTPPGRVFAAVDLEEAALVDTEAGRVVRAWGLRPTREPAWRTGYRESAGGWDAVAAIPQEVAERIGRAGRATLAVEAPDGLRVVPALWAAHGGALLAALPAAVLRDLGAGRPEAPVALTVDRASAWRARAMAGAMFQGPGSVHGLDGLRTGAGSAARAVRRTGLDPAGAVLVRVHPGRAVWWRGWSSGTVAPA